MNIDDISPYYATRTAIAYGYVDVVKRLLPRLSLADVQQIQLDFDWTRFGKPFTSPYHLNRNLYWGVEYYLAKPDYLDRGFVEEVDKRVYSKKARRVIGRRLAISLAVRDVLFSNHVVFDRTTKNVYRINGIPHILPVEFLNPRDCMVGGPLVDMFNTLGFMEFLPYWGYLINENGRETAWTYLNQIRGRQNLTGWQYARDVIKKHLMNLFGLRR